MNFPFICSNIPAAPAYGVYISQLIRYSRTYGSCQDFIDRGLLLTRKLLNQWFILVKLKSSLQTFYGRIMTLLNVMEYLYHKWSLICSTLRKHFPVLPFCMTYHTTGATSGAGTAYPSGTPQFIPIFSGVRVTRSLVCVVCSSIYGFWLPLWYLQALLLLSSLMNLGYIIHKLWALHFLQQDQQRGPPYSIPTLGLILIVLAHWNNSPRVDMLLHSDTLFWFIANQSLLFLLNAACLADKQQIQIFIVFGLTRPGLEPTSHHTQCEHANHCATDMVRNVYDLIAVTENRLKYVSTNDPRAILID